MAILTPDQIDCYNENGFLHIKGFIDPEVVKSIRAEIEGIHERMASTPSADRPNAHVTWEDLPEGEPKKIRQLMGSQHVSQTIASIISSNKMIGAMVELLGDEVELFHSKLMMKAAKKGSFTPWHSDWGYWRNTFKTPRLMNAFLAIDHSTLENGCIRYVPGSHKEYLEHTQNKSASGFGIGLPSDVNAFENIPIEMEPGDVAFHDAICIHASEANTSAHSRIMNTFAYTVKDNYVRARSA
jgi:phytanoyl-CoA hydroxylase